MSGDDSAASDFARARRIAELEGLNPGSLEARASIGLKILAVMNIGGVVLAMFPGVAQVSTLFVVTFNTAGGLLAVVYLAGAFGLDRRRPWAIAAVRPLLGVIAVAGTLQVLAWFTDGRIRIPFDVAIAGWAFLGPANARPIAGQQARSIAAVGTSAALAAVMVFGPQLFGWGGLVDVHPPDLSAAVTADCGDPAAGPPQHMTLGYDWSWRSAALLPNGADIVVLGWTGADPQGRPLYLIDTIPGSASGVYSGLAGYPSTDMATAIGKESEGSFRWAIELGEQKFAPGHIELQLVRPREAPAGRSSVKITASYIHLGLWRKDAATVTCSW
ncbi:MAG: hypothetical protein HYX55_01075 [Chloroflexi bacterium]|nr:hypothetical protein [Chloroflexota bacterium]